MKHSQLNGLPFICHLLTPARLTLIINVDEIQITKSCKLEDIKTLSDRRIGNLNSFIAQLSAFRTDGQFFESLHYILSV